MSKIPNKSTKSSTMSSPSSEELKVGNVVNALVTENRQLKTQVAAQEIELEKLKFMVASRDLENLDQFEMLQILLEENPKLQGQNLILATAIETYQKENQHFVDSYNLLAKAHKEKNTLIAKYQPVVANIKQMLSLQAQIMQDVAGL